MKIAFIGSRGFPGFNGGVEKSLEEVCPRMAERGHEITLYCSGAVSVRDLIYKKTILKRMPAISTRHLETFSRTFLSAVDSIFRAYDIVHFHSIGPALLSWVGRLSSSKVVVTVHGLDWQREKWGLVARASLKVGEKAAVLFPHRTVVVSKHLERHYKNKYNKEVAFIPNGVNVEKPLVANLISQKWGLSAKNYVLFVSRLVPEKECHTLIKAFRQIKTDKKLVIAGASWHSDNYAAELKKLAEGDSQIIFTGWAEGEILKELYSNAYLYCLPSTIEGLSLGLLEGMSYGLCPVVSDIPENTDVLEGNGVTFKTRDVTDLAQKMQELIENPAKVERLGKSAKECVLENYSWDRYCDDLEKIYQELLSRDPG